MVRSIRRRRRFVWAVLFLCACGGTGGIPVIEDPGAGLGGDASVPDATLVEAGSDPDSGGGGDDGSSKDARSDATSADASDAGASDGSTGQDAAKDAGIVSDPGVVECGSSKCDTPGHFCCVSGLGTTNDGGTRSCVDAGPFACVGGNEQRCDEAADCKGNEICCARLTLSGVEMTCQSKQIGCVLSVQVCTTDAECGQNGPCYPHVCGSRVLGVCGLADAGDRCP